MRLSKHEASRQHEIGQEIHSSLHFQQVYRVGLGLIIAIAVLGAAVLIGRALLLWRVL